MLIFFAKKGFSRAQTPQPCEDPPALQNTEICLPPLTLPSDEEGPCSFRPRGGCGANTLIKLRDKRRECGLEVAVMR